MTSSDVIASLDYLQKDFMPSDLTKAQLAGVLGNHAIAVPLRAKKDELVELFERHIVPQREELLRLHEERANVKASDEGIIDGQTGILLSATRRSVSEPSLSTLELTASVGSRHNRRHGHRIQDCIWQLAMDCIVGYDAGYKISRERLYVCHVACDRLEDEWGVLSRFLLDDGSLDAFDWPGAMLAPVFRASAARPRLRVRVMLACFL